MRHEVTRSASKNEIIAIIKHLDKEFIYSRYRSVSLEFRFQNVFMSGSTNYFRVLEVDGDLGAFVAIRPFEMRMNNETIKGAMLGMVWVRDDMRGKGIGSKLMYDTNQFLANLGLDCAVLWTHKHSFYTKFGWLLKDIGMFGRVFSTGDNVFQYELRCQPLHEMDTEWLEIVRSKLLSSFVTRTNFDYASLPIPATDVYCYYYRSDKPDAFEGFSLVGVEGEINGYLYEVVAPTSLYPDIFATLCAKYQSLFVNLSSLDPFLLWIIDKHKVDIKLQNSTMWLKFSEKAKALISDGIYINYFDRI